MYYLLYIIPGYVTIHFNMFLLNQAHHFFFRTSEQKKLQHFHWQNYCGLHYTVFFKLEKIYTKLIYDLYE